MPSVLDAVPQASLVKLEIVAALVAIGIAAGAFAGWQVNGWRLSAKIERLQGKVNLVDGANDRCAVAVKDVHETIAELRSDEKKRGENAAAAVKLAEATSKAHLDAVKEALNRSPAKPGEECATVAREAREYVDKRRGRRGGS